MPIATIRPMGESGLYHIHFLDGAEHPSHGLPGFPGRPDQGLPGGRPPHVSGGPIYPGGHPDQGLPGSGIPDNTLPSTPPPTLLPGYTLVMMRGPDGRWRYAAIKPGQPIQPLPEPLPPGGLPDQGLPPQPVRPDQGLPPTAAPKPV